ncbi:MAG TPA: ABC transporter permease [Thermomicrobiales bacterium]|nr:ABC transporter permease [Thermomicrobiales bacterium]
MASAPLASNDVSHAATATPSAQRRFWRRLRGERKAILGMLIVAILTILAVVGPALAPYDPEADDFDLFAEPSMEHPLGTDSFGRDILSRMMAGTQISFTVGISVALLSLVIGVTLGMVAGYFGGWIDSLIMRFMDLLWAFPEIILAVGMVAVFGAGIRNIIVAIAIAYLDDFARVVRAEVLRLREEDFSLAARASGASHVRIMFRHILPNTMAPIIVQATFAVGLGILAESGLTFLGLGVDPSTPTWGLIINEGRDFVRQAWWISVFPGVAIMITVLGLNLLGDGLRDTLDVRGIQDAS